MAGDPSDEPNDGAASALAAHRANTWFGTDDESAASVPDTLALHLPYPGSAASARTESMRTESMRTDPVGTPMITGEVVNGVFDMRPAAAAVASPQLTLSLVRPSDRPEAGGYSQGRPAIPPDAVALLPRPSDHGSGQARRPGLRSVVAASAALAGVSVLAATALLSGGPDLAAKGRGAAVIEPKLLDPSPTARADVSESPTSSPSSSGSIAVASGRGAESPSASTAFRPGPTTTVGVSGRSPAPSAHGSAHAAASVTGVVTSDTRRSGASLTAVASNSTANATLTATAGSGSSVSSVSGGGETTASAPTNGLGAAGALPPALATQYRARQPTSLSQAIVLLQDGVTASEKQALTDVAAWTGVADQVSAWFSRASGGLFSYRRVEGAVLTADASRRVQNMSARSRCASSEAAQDAREGLRARGITADSMIVVFSARGCNFGGLGTVGEPAGAAGVVWSPPQANLDAAVHELGHNLGLHHPRYVICPSGDANGCTGSGEGYGPTVMAGSGWQVGLSAPERLFTGFLPAEQLWVTHGNGTVQLVPAYAPEDVAGVRVLEVVASPSRRYLIERRVPTARLDAGLADSPGVRVYRVDTLNGRPDYSQATLIRVASSNDRGALAPGTVIRDGTMRISVGADGLLTVSGLSAR